MAKELPSSLHHTSDFLSLLAAHQPHSAVRSTDQMTPTELTEYLMKDTIAACPTLQPDFLPDEEELPQSKSCHYIKTEPAAMQVKEDFPDNMELVCEEVKFGIADNDLESDKSTYERPFACNLCDYRGKQRGHLVKHKLSVHISKRLFACDQCDYRGKRQSHLDAHKLVHSKEKPFACDKCNYRAGLKHQLKTHHIIHNSEKPFGCDECDYRTAYKTGLKRHKLVHGSEKPFACDECDYKTIWKEHINRHKVVHSSAKPFTCYVCYVQTKTKERLVRHYNAVHKTEQPFSWDLCDFKTNLKMQYRCQICRREFSGPSFLRQHTKAKHAMLSARFHGFFK